MKDILDLSLKIQYNQFLQRIAEIAQLVEHFTRNEGVVGSSPIFSLSGEMAVIRLQDCSHFPLYMTICSRQSELSISNHFAGEFIQDV